MRYFINLIRKIERGKKAALVLGSGAARGLAHIGVIKALKEQNTPIGLIVGASMGALVGACYAKNRDISEFEDLVLRMDWKRLLQLADFNLLFASGGFIQGQKVTNLLKTILGDITFADLKIPLAIVAADLNTGEEVIIKDGSVLEAVMASISMPVVFVPVKRKNRFLIDGGIVNPLPIDVAKKMGARFIIGSNALPNPSQLNSKGLNANAPGVFDVFAQAFYIMQYEIVKSKRIKADILIDPDTSRISTLEFYRSKELILEGYNAAKKALSPKKKHRWRFSVR